MIDIKTLKTQIEEILRASEYFREQEKDRFYYVSGNQYVIQYRPDEPDIPLGWASLYSSNYISEDQYPIWLKNLYFQVNEMHFEYHRIKGMVNSRKRRSLDNLSYVYSCLYGSKEFITDLKMYHEHTSIIIPHEYKMDEFIKEYSRAAEKEGYEIKVERNKISTIIQCD